MRTEAEIKERIKILSRELEELKKMKYFPHNNFYLALIESIIFYLTWVINENEEQQ